MIKKRFREFIGTGTLTIFDIDETLFHTKANVAVVKDGKVVRMLDNQQFNTYKRQKGETYDFGQFKNAEIFRKTSTPIGRMVAKAKIIFANSKKNPHSRVIICTARADFDNKDVFLQTFRDHGLPIDQIHVERAGNLQIDSSAEAKKIIFRKYINTKNYVKLRLFDDAPSNLQAFLSLQQDYPNIKFEAYFVNPDGSVRTVR
jgi:hypothetical protein